MEGRQVSGVMQVSVIIPACNAARTLAETLDSVLAQSHPAGEVIVVNDGSSDATADVARGFAGVRLLAIEHPNTYFVVPQHPNPAVRQQLANLGDLPNVCLTDALSYPEFARLMARSYLIITDSGGIQEEAPSLGKPVLVCRESTERGEGVEAGTLRLVGTDPARIQAEADLLLKSEAAYQAMSEAENPYGDGRASERIVAALTNLYVGGKMPEPFRSTYSRNAVIKASGYTLPGEASGRLDPALVPESERHHEEAVVDPVGNLWAEFGTITEKWFRT